MESLPTPHNNFFQFAISHLPTARRLIETQLQQQALARHNKSMENLSIMLGGELQNRTFA